MPPKRTTTPAEEPETAEQSAVPSPEPGFLELRVIPGRQDMEVWISNRKVFGTANGHELIQQLGRLLQLNAYHPDRMANHVTILHARIEGLPTEEEWEQWDAEKRARAAAQNAPPPATAEAPAPSGQEDDEDDDE